MRLLHLGLALLLVFIWGFNFVAIEAALHGMPPLLLSAARFFLTSIPFVFFVKFPATSFKWVALYGLVMFALQFAFFFMGMYVGITAGLASLLIQSHVFFTILLAALFLGEKLRPWQVVGALVSFSGIGYVGIHTGGSATFLGFLLIIGAALAWGIGNLISKKIGKVDMIALVIWSSLIAWPPLLGLSFMIERPEKIFSSLANLSWISAGSALYIAYLSTLLGFGIWSWLIHHYPLSMIAPFTLLVPIVAIVCSVLVLGEPLQLWKIIAGILVIAGLGINLLGPRLFKRRLL